MERIIYLLLFQLLIKLLLISEPGITLKTWSLQAKRLAVKELDRPSAQSRMGLEYNAQVQPKMAQSLQLIPLPRNHLAGLLTEWLGKQSRLYQQ